MFLKKLFSKKSWQEYEAKGDQLLIQERYADARHEFEGAFECLGVVKDVVDPVIRQRLDEKITATGYQLALLNIREARSAKACGDVHKAEEYLDLAAHFSQDPGINREIADIISDMSLSEQPQATVKGAHGCATCTPHEPQPAESAQLGLHSLSPEEQYEILISPLPDTLPAAYRKLGQKFASAYLCAHNGDLASAYSTYAQLHTESPSDICLYEMAIIKAHNGAIHETEKLLKEALLLNSANPLCCLSLVQLYSDQRRYGDARTLLNRMHTDGIMGNQVLLMLGDTAMAVGSVSEAEEFYRSALEDKSLAATAAERLVPILEQSGRLPERDFLVKKHCGKGCC